LCCRDQFRRKFHWDPGRGRLVMSQHLPTLFGQQ
jgi:hypothetical protein